MEATNISAAQAGTLVIGGDLAVNRLGFGAMRLTGPGIWGQPADREEAKAVLRRAVELGTNFIDTADSYGPHVSETIIAEALYPYPDDLMIATKGGLERTGPDRWPHDARPEHLKAACEGSLRRLRLERIPLYQLHRPDPAVPYEDSVGALVELKQEGKIHHIGVSNVDEGLLEIAQALTPVASVQNRYNFGDRESEALVDVCEREGMAFLPWAPMHDIDEKELATIAANHHAGDTAGGPGVAAGPIAGDVADSWDWIGRAHLETNVGAAGLRLDPDEILSLTTKR